MSTIQIQAPAPIQLTELSRKSSPPSPPLQTKKSLLPTTNGQTLSSRNSIASLNNLQDSTPPDTSVDVLQRWNNPRGNIGRIAAASFALFVLGMNDACYGTLLPSLEKHYNLSYTTVSLVFIAPFVGFTLASLSNHTIHQRLGRRGIAMIGPVFQIVPYAVLCSHPPFAAIVPVIALVGYGSGLLDAGLNAWTGNLAHSNEVLGILHGFYGLGAVVAPLIATGILSKGHPWWDFFYVMLGMAVVGCGLLIAAFRSQNGAAYRQEQKRTQGSNPSGMREAMKNKVTWITAFFLLFYVGAEVALGGWIVTFMIKIRSSSPVSAGITSSGFWIGLTVGRFTLGFITPRLGERIAVSAYLICAMGLELLFWLVPQKIVSSIAVALVGFFIGPLFPSAIMAETRILPKYLHVGAVGFSAAFGSGGGALFPFAVGAIAQKKGVQVLQPIVLAMFAILLMLWWSLPSLKKHQA